MKKLLLIASILILAACSKISGTYTNKDDTVSYTFGSGGKVTQEAMGMEVETDYEVEGNKIKIKTPQGNVILTVMDDGSIRAPFGVLKKKK